MGATQERGLGPREERIRRSTWLRGLELLGYQAWARDAGMRLILRNLSQRSGKCGLCMAQICALKLDIGCRDRSSGGRRTSSPTASIWRRG